MFWLGRRERHRDRPAGILDHSASGKSPCQGWTLAVVLQNVERDLLVPGSEFDQMTFHRDDLAAIVAFLDTLRRRGEGNSSAGRRNREQCPHPDLP
jgi:hypothetical protein